MRHERSAIFAEGDHITGQALVSDQVGCSRQDSQGFAFCTRVSGERTSAHLAATRAVTILEEQHRAAELEAKVSAEATASKTAGPLFAKRSSHRGQRWSAAPYRV